MIVFATKHNARIHTFMQGVKRFACHYTLLQLNLPFKWNHYVTYFRNMFGSIFVALGWKLYIFYTCFANRYDTLPIFLWFTNVSCPLNDTEHPMRKLELLGPVEWSTRSSAAGLLRGLVERSIAVGRQYRPPYWFPLDVVPWAVQRCILVGPPFPSASRLDGFRKAFGLSTCFLLLRHFRLASFVTW